MSQKTKGLKIDYKRTLLIGFGFLAVSLAWSMYNANVPLMLEKTFKISSTFLIGVIMSIDNIFAVLFQPVFGRLSDRTVSPRGRRMPFILIGLPICAVLFFFIPFTQELYLLMGTVILFNFVMSTWRAPVIALMPDITPPPLRSLANGIINLMGGIGGIIAFLAGAILLGMGDKLGGYQSGYKMTFAFGALVMLISWCCLYFFVREPKILSAQEAEDIRNREAEAQKKQGKVINRSLLLILFAIFFWFIGYNAIETFFTLYATNVLHMSKSMANMTLVFFSLSMVVGAIPAGLLGTHFGRKKIIMIGLAIIAVLFGVQYLVTDLLIIRILLILAGLAWALININSLPMVVEIAKSSRIGQYTGYYYFFSASAAILGPILFGFIKDIITKSYTTLFFFCIVAFLIALGCMMYVRHGEADVSEEEVKKEAELLDD